MYDFTNDQLDAIAAITTPQSYIFDRSVSITFKWQNDLRLLNQHLFSINKSNSRQFS